MRPFEGEPGSLAQEDRRHWPGRHSGHREVGSVTRSHSLACWVFTCEWG